MFGPLQGRRWRSRAIASCSKDRALRLSIFVAALSAAIAIGVIGTDFIAARSERERSKSELLLLQAHTLANTVDLEVAEAVAVLRGLAASSTLARGDFSQLQAEMQLAGEGSEASICLVDWDGQVLGASAASGSPPSPGRQRIHGFLDAIAAAATGTHKLLPSSYFGVHRLDVVYPLTDHRVGSGTPGALVYSIAPHRLIALLSARHLPRHTTVSIIDPHGIVAASTAVPDQAGQPASAELMGTLMGGDHGMQALDEADDRMLLAWARAPQTKIEVAITSPPPALLPALGRIVKPAIGLVLCLFAIAASLFLYRRSLERSGKRLAGSAAAIGRAAACTSDREVLPFQVDLASATPPAIELAAALAPDRQIAEPVGRSQQASDAVREQSLHAQRLEVMGTLASGVAHDFGNVLQALDGSVRLIRDNPTDIPAVEHSTDVMLDVLGGARSVVRRLLSFARDEALETADYEVGAMLGGLVEILRPALPRQIAIKLTVPDGLPRMHIDKFRLEATLLNLAMNAQHAMPTGGTLTISACLDPAPPTAQGNGKPLDGEYVRIDTADTGTGMSAAVLARATEAFFTTKPAGQGTGLGLSSARSFAEESGGTLRISSELGQGTIVSLWLPRAAETPSLPHAVDEPSLTPAITQASLPLGLTQTSLPLGLTQTSLPLEPGARELVAQRPTPEALPVSIATPAVSGEAPGPLSILLVDDEPMIRDVLARQLGRRGMAVKVCADAAEALAALASPQAFDLLLTDFAMPDMAGDVLVAEARKLRAGLPVIVLTGHPHDAEILGNRSGESNTRLLSKPISGRELADEIDQLLGRVSGT